MTEAVVATIGYQGRAIGALTDTLLESNIDTLVDVRWSARSRLRSYNRQVLASTLGEHGIRYHHDRRLGTPPEMLAQARIDGYEFERYREFLLGSDGALEDLADLAANSRIALMCFEALHTECHRTIVVDELSELLPSSGPRFKADCPPKSRTTSTLVRSTESASRTIDYDAALCKVPVKLAGLKRCAILRHPVDP